MSERFKEWTYADTTRKELIDEHNRLRRAWQDAEAECERLGKANSDLCDEIAAARPESRPVKVRLGGDTYEREYKLAAFCQPVPEWTDAQIEALARVLCEAYGTAPWEVWNDGCQARFRDEARAAVDYMRAAPPKPRFDCIFCGHDGGDMDGLKAHNAECTEHPLWAYKDLYEICKSDKASCIGQLKHLQEQYFALVNIPAPTVDPEAWKTPLELKSMILETHKLKVFLFEDGAQIAVSDKGKRVNCTISPADAAAMALWLASFAGAHGCPVSLPAPYTGPTRSEAEAKWGKMCAEDRGVAVAEVALRFLDYIISLLPESRTDGDDIRIIDDPETFINHVHVAELYESSDGRVDIVPTGNMKFTYFVDGKRLVPEPEPIAAPETLEALAEMAARIWSTVSDKLLPPDEAYKVLTETWQQIVAAILHGAQAYVDLEPRATYVTKNGGDLWLNADAVNFLNSRIRYRVAEAPNGLPTAEELAKISDAAYCEVYDIGGNWDKRCVGHREGEIKAAEAILAALRPWLRDPVAWELDVTAEEFARWHQDTKHSQSSSYDIFDDLGENYKEDFIVAAESSLNFLRSRIRPVFECAECALYERQIGAIRSVCDTRNMPSIHAESPEVKCRECVDSLKGKSRILDAWNEHCRLIGDSLERVRAALEGE